jgi:hypothetical protein
VRTVGPRLLRRPPVRANLTTDWSDATNPFGPSGAWALYEAPTTQFLDNWPDYWDDGLNQAAWAFEPFPGQPSGHVPYWMKITSLYSCGWCADGSRPLYPGFATAGTVVVSTAQNNAHPGPTSVVWTSPRAGVASVNGGVWLNKNLRGRPQKWTLSLNGTVLRSGDLTDGDPYTQSNPFLFRNGSGGPSAVSFAVKAGDQVKLTVFLGVPGGPGNDVGVVFRVQIAP